MSEGVELVTGQSNFLIDQITGLLVGQTHGDLTPGHVSSRAVDIDVPNGSRVVANAVDDINVNRMIPDIEVSGVDLPNGIREIPDGVQAGGIDNIAGTVDVVNTGKVPEVDLPRGKVDVKTGIEGGTGGIKFDIDEIRPQLKTEPDTAFFWSGKTDGVGGADVAAEIAKEKGGVTLESTIDTKGITMPEWDFNNPSSMDAWDMASAAYAEQVSGEVRAVVGAELRLGNIWENVELPRLMENPNVTKITIIDPKTGIEIVVFER